MDVLDTILKINNLLDRYTNNKISSKDLFKLYQIDFCMLLLEIYNSATIMINNKKNSCALLINGTLYNSYGIINKSEYQIATKQDLLYLKLSFKQLPEDIYLKLKEEIKLINNKEKYNVYKLRKNNNSFI